MSYRISFVSSPSSSAAIWDPESMSQRDPWFPYDEEEEEDLAELESAAPKKNCKQLKESGDTSWLESHLAWPDSFFQWYGTNGRTSLNHSRQNSTNALHSVICLEQIEDDEDVRWLRCGHIFHSRCIDAWYLRKHFTCPVCITQMV